MYNTAKNNLVQAYALHQRFWIYARPSARQIMLALGLTMLLPLLATFTYSLIQKLTDTLFYAVEKDMVPWLASAVVLIGLAKLTLKYIDHCLDARIAEQIAQQARVGLYSKLLAAQIEQGRSIGDLLAHLDEDTNRIASLVYGVPVGLFAHCMTALFFLIFLLTLSWQLTLIALLVMPLLGWAVFSLAPVVRRRAHIARNYYSRWMSRAEERLGALALIRVSNAENFELAAFNRATEKSRNAEIQAQMLDARQGYAINLITGLGSALVLLAGLYQVSHQAMTVGAVLAFVAAVGSLYDPLRGITQGSGRWQRSVASAQRLEKLIMAPPVIEAPEATNEKKKIQGTLQLNHLAFSYNGPDKVLKNISLTIAAGEHVALVGASGCGKSTLLKILAGLEKPSSGTVKIDEVDLHQFSKAQLHDCVAIAFQEPYLFSGSVADNIRYNMTQAQSVDILKAGEKACANKFTQLLPLAYGTPVGCRGGRLSGGQRQRVSLARALVRKAPILLLDEAMSALDSETEELIHQALRTDFECRTMVTVSHRLSSVRAADRIVVLDQGEIIEQGTAEKLLRPHTRCYELFAAQIAAEQNKNHSEKKLVVGSI